MYNQIKAQQLFNREARKVERNNREQLLNLYFNLANRFQSIKEHPDFRDLPYGQFMPRDWRIEGIQTSIRDTKSDLQGSYRSLSRLANQQGLSYVRPWSEAEIKQNIDLVVNMAEKGNPNCLDLIAISIKLSER